MIYSPMAAKPVSYFLHPVGKANRKLIVIGVRRPLRKESPHGLGQTMSSFISFSIEHRGSNSLKDSHGVFTLSPEFNLTGNVHKTGAYSFAGGGFGEIYRGIWTNPEGTKVDVSLSRFPLLCYRSK